MRTTEPFSVPLTTGPCERLELLEGLLAEPCPELDVVAATRLDPQDALSWVQERGYVPDPADVEQLQPLIWTINHGGDCEDLSSLVVGLLRKMGYQAEVVWITQEGHDLNHVTARVMIDGAWQWADASILGALIGENPYTAAARLSKQHVLGRGRR